MPLIIKKSDRESLIELVGTIAALFVVGILSIYFSWGLAALIGFVFCVSFAFTGNLIINFLIKKKLIVEDESS